MDFANCVADDSFGPVVDGCRGGFDFTLKFELLFFVITPSAIFLVLAVLRTIVLYREPAIAVWRSWLYASKQLFIFVNTALHLCLLVMSTQGTARYKLSSYFISAQSLGMGAALAMAVMSHYEHSYSQRPSVVLNIYLSLTILLDVAHDRTIWLSISSSLDRAFARVFTAAVACKAVLIVLESRSKTRLIIGHDQTKQSLDGTRGIYSLSTFSWLSRLFLSGYRSVLFLDELPLLDENMAVEALESQFAKHAKRRLRDPTKANLKSRLGLMRALGETLLVPFLLPILPKLALVGFSLSQAFIIESVLDFLRSGKTSRPAGYGLIGATILTYAGIAVSGSLYWYYHQRLLYMARGCLVSAIFRKTTELSVATLAMSQAVTLMSTDVDRILSGFLNLHELWASFLQAALGSWLLWNRLGASFVVPICLVTACFLALATLGRYVGGFQKAWMQETQKRVAMTANSIASMKQVKISGLAAAVEERTQRARITELRASRGLRMLQIAAMGLSLTPELVAPVITLAATSRTLTTPEAFTVIALLSLLTAPLGQLFTSVAPLMSALACLNRIQTYLELEPIADFRALKGKKARPSAILGGTNKTIASSDGTRGQALRVVRGSFGWQKNGPFCLRNINLTIKYSTLTMIVGPVGSGKSTLCKALLGETPLSAGEVLVDGEVGGRIAYCDQTPFLSNSTIRNNIVSFSRWDARRYVEAVEASGLSRDLAELPHGHDTLVGSNGLMLSGGQKQRIAIARALYLDSRILVFDDVLSGLDAKTEEHVFHHVFGPEGLLKTRRDGQAVVLCTHSVMHLPSADHIVALGDQGEVVEQGSWEALMHNNGYVQSLGVGEAAVEDGKRYIVGKDSAAVPQTGSSTQGSTAPLGPRAAEERDGGPASAGLDGVVRMAGDLANYRHYFKAVSVVALMAFVVSALIYGFFFAFPTVWLNFWLRDAESMHPTHSKGFWIGIYGLFQVLALVGGLLTMYLAVSYISLTSGASLHLSVLRAVMRAPLSLFATTDLGTLTNYFSQDMTLIDGELPTSLIQFACDLAISLSMAGVLASSSPYLATTYPIVIALLYAIAKFYLRTSRQLRLLELEAKGPLYAHFLDVGRGIATIRAAHLVESYADQNHRLLDASQRPAYQLAMVQYWLLFMLNVVVMLLAILTVTLVTQLKSHGTEFAGPGLVMLLQLGQILTTTVRAYAKLETSMGAVHRLKALCENIVSEAVEGEKVVPPLSWPFRGHIKLEGISASYAQGVNDGDDAQGSLALKDLRLVVEPGQTVALCGRSGSGKSSFLLLLLRLLDPLPSSRQGDITIDGLPLHTVDRAVLPQRIIAVPQDAIFLPAGASWQENLDLLGACSEAECRSVLEDVNLWVSVGCEDGALTAAMKPDELSHGQKQLFSLARAVLRKRVKDRGTRHATAPIEVPSAGQSGCGKKVWRSNRNRPAEAAAGVEDQRGSYSPSKPRPWHELSVVAGRRGGVGGILLLDEANSSMDSKTERSFYEIIRREFPGYTVIVITHSLTTFVASPRGDEGGGPVGEGPDGFFDRVIVLDSGAIVEDGRPTELLQARHSRFRKLCEAAARGNDPWQKQARLEE